MNHLVKKQYKAFTLVELIVSITILAILGTLSFISYSRFTQNVRDSVRQADTHSINTSLALYEINNNTYPAPTDGHTVAYGSYPLWIEWSFWHDTRIQLKNVSWDFLDPKYEVPYTYSTTIDKKEYQLGAIYERTDIGSDILTSLQKTKIFPQIYAEQIEDHPIKYFDPHSIPDLQFWYDGVDVDGDSIVDNSDILVANVWVIGDIVPENFSPFYFDRVIWLDAQDINWDGSVVSDSDTITSWKNKTGIGYDGFVPQTWNNHISPSYSTPPTYSANGFGGNPWVAFDGVAKWNRIVIDRWTQPNASGFSLAYTFQINDSTTNHATILSVWPTWWGAYHNKKWWWQLSRDGLNNAFIFRIRGNVVSRTYYNWTSCSTCWNSWSFVEVAFWSWDEVNDNTPHSVFLTFEWNTLTGYLDGTKRFEAVFNDTVKPYGEYFRFFGNRAGTAYLQWMLGEVFIANDRMSLQDIEKIEWYFARRWWWLNSLPSTHPYKSTSPQMDASSQLEYGRYSWDGSDYDPVTFFSSAPTILSSQVVRYPGSMPYINIEEDGKIHIWKWLMKVSQTGNYTFSVEADDYAAIRINEEEVLSVRNGTTSAQVQLLQGETYLFEEVYWEQTGKAVFDTAVYGPGVIGYRLYEVFSWKDKSNNNTTLVQSDEAFQPIYNPLERGFDVSWQKYFQWPSSLLSSSQGFEVFAIWDIKNTNATSLTQGSFLENNGSAWQNISLGAHGMIAGSNQTISPTGVVGKGTTMTSYTYNIPSSSQEFTVNGKNIIQNTTSINLGNNTFFIGGKDDIFDGTLKEVIAYEWNLTDTQREDIEWYLMHRWGIPYLLPADHPYYVPLDTGEQTYVEVTGDYNGLFTLGKSGDSYVAVLSPSLISSKDIDSWETIDITSIYGENTWVYNGFNNVPSTYVKNLDEETKLTKKDGFFFSLGQPKIFEWSFEELQTDTALLEIDKQLRNVYTNSSIYPYVAPYFESYTTDYITRIISRSFWKDSTIVPRNCQEVFLRQQGINIALQWQLQWSSWNDASQGIDSLLDTITIYEEPYSYLTNLGDIKDITLTWDELRKVNLARIFNSLGQYSENLSYAKIQFVNSQTQAVVHEQILWDTRNTSVIEILVPSNGAVADTLIIRPSTDFDQIALREIEVFQWQTFNSGYYTVDADGYGGNPPEKVYCDITGN